MEAGAKESDALADKGREEREARKRQADNEAMARAKKEQREHFLLACRAGDMEMVERALHA
ncbi:hypothetical protein Gpo141_00014213, partial [Globisporangium polare]